MPEATALLNARLLDPGTGEVHAGGLLLENGQIAGEIPPGSSPSGVNVADLGGRLIAPGYLDVHFHGKLPFSAPERLEHALGEDARELARHGVTAFLPTTVARNDAPLAACVRAVGRCVISASSSASDAASKPLGIHLEGPWIAPDAAGAQPAGAIRPYDAAAGASILDAADGTVRLVTLAPEVPGALTLLAELGRRGIVAAVGHSRASAAALESGIDAGLRHATHLFNAMGPVHHRDLGVAGVALTDDRITCDLICDGCHVHPAMVRLAARAKGDRLLLISDHIDPPGDATDFGSGPVHDDGTALRLPGGTLAGSTLHLDCAVSLAVQLGAMTLPEAVAAATIQPARLLGVEAEHGTLRPGSRADLVVLEEDGTLVETWLAGVRVARASEGAG